MYFCYPFLFLPELFPFLELQSAGCPSFVSLLHRFWLNGFFIFWDNDCLSLLIIRNHHCLSLFCKDLFGAICYALGSTERTTLPQVIMKGFNFRKEKKTPTSLAQRGWRGIIILITPVFRDWNNACTSSTGSVQKHTVDCGIVFVILPQEA